MHAYAQRVFNTQCERQSMNTRTRKGENDKEKFFFFFISSFVVWLPYGVQPADTACNKKNK